MTLRFASLALLLMPAFCAAQSVSASAANPPSLENRTALRCSAAFAIVANGQTRGDKKALAYPALAARGREFLVRTSARIMDDTGMDRTAVAAELRAEAQALREKAETDQIMPACLLLLEGSGL